jgi:hypothetical protein
VKHNQPKEYQMFGRRKKEQEREPSLKELCDAVAAHPDTVLVAVFDVNDFPLGTDYIDHEYLRDAIYDLVMESANN